MNTKVKSHSKKSIKLKYLNRNIIILVLAILFALMTATAFYYRYQFVIESKSIDSYNQQTWNEGEIIIDDRFAFSLNSVYSDTTEIPNFWELNDGDRFVLVNISFKNTSSVDYQLSPITSMQILDVVGNVYTVSSAPAIKNPLGGAVLPGVTVRGEVGFEIPEDVTQAKFIFNPNLEGAHLIEVNIVL